MRRPPLAVLVPVLVIGLALAAGCSLNDGGTIVVSGTVTYTSYDPTASGLDYANPHQKPVRGAIVELQRSGGSVYATTTTGSDGRYAVSAPSDENVRVVVRAALGTSADVRARVVDNTQGQAEYVIFADLGSHGKDTTADLNAGSGWGGSSYTSARAAAPFAILDVVYSGRQLVLAADPTANLPLLLINWSPSNIPSSTFDIAAGDIGTTSYDPGTKQLYVLGAEDIDTDEYDAHVIAHEWTHYLEDRLGRSDSLGGSHSGGDVLDPTVAFSEGFANAASGMVLGGDPIYIDTRGAQQGAVAVRMDLEADEVSDSATWTGTTDPLVDSPRRLDGPWSELSVQEVLWDLYDAHADDVDAANLGFAPLYRALTGGQKITSAFTSIFSFLEAVRQQAPSAVSAITTIAAGENIVFTPGDAFDTGAGTRGTKQYTTLTLALTSTPQTFTSGSDDTPARALVTRTTYGPITTTDEGNKLFNRMLFRFQLPATGRYDVVATPVTPTPTGRLVAWVPGHDGTLGAIGSSLTFAISGNSGANAAFAIGSRATGSVPTGQTQFSLTITFTPGLPVGSG